MKKKNNNKKIIIMIISNAHLVWAQQQLGVHETEDELGQGLGGEVREGTQLREPQGVGLGGGDLYNE